MQENYIVSARKYRPASFETVVGQRALTETLRNAIRSNHLAHAYLFCGPRGVGKTTCARIFAKTINCLTPTADHDACNECESCRAFNEQRSFNIHELDAASNNSVDDIRSLIEQVRIPPQIGKYSVYIIDEVHMLSQGAFNALLKTLEEPPSYAVFILATTEKHKVLPTILSRCQVFDFARMTILDMVNHLQYVASQEGIEVETNALHVVAQKADGGMRDALSIFDQLVTFCGNHITYQQAIEVLNVLDNDYYFRVIDAALQTNVQAALLLFNEILCKGFDAGHFIMGLASHLRDVLVSKDAATVTLLETSDELRQRFAQQAAQCHPRWIFAALDLLNQTDINYRTARHKRLTVEMMLVKLCTLLMPADSATNTTAAPITNSATTPAAAAQQAPHSTAQAVAAPQQTSQQATAPQQVARPTIPTVPTAPRTTAVPGANVPGATMPGSAVPGMPTGMHVPGMPTVMPTASGAAHAQQAANNANQTASADSQAPTKAPESRPFTPEQMTEAWIQMSKQLFASDKRFMAMLSNMVIKPISDSSDSGEGDRCVNYQVELQNAVQETEMNQAKPQILTFLRDHLCNSQITLQFIIHQQEKEQIAYTAEEKYRLLSKANPHVEELKQLLNLSID